MATTAALRAVIAQNDHDVAGTVPRLPVSVEFGTAVAWAVEDQYFCRALCRRMLAGGDIRFVRLPGGPAYEAAGRCCISRPADLRLILVEVEPAPRRGLAWATRVQLLVLEDAEGHRIAAQTLVHWQAYAPGLLAPALAAFDGPAQPMGLVPTAGSSGRMDVADLLEEAGLRPAP